MALSNPTDTDQPEEATTEAPGPGGRTPRERYDALPQSIKDLILDKYRDWNVEHIDWWDGVYDCFKSEMEELGIEVDRMYFSGFWSQGDGACFEGRVSEWEKFLQALGYTDPALINHAVDHFSFYVKHSGHYYHENCTQFSADLPLPEHDEDTHFAESYCNYERDGIQEAVWLALLSKYSWSDLEARFIEFFKDKMLELYRRLEEEHDYLTSDDAVLEALEANEQLEDAINDAINEEEEYA